MASQHLGIPAKSRSSDGCWTCRLRRKKCDETRPVCVGCSVLEIDCLYSDVKPGWMDGAERQKEKADWLKLEVKRLAAARRERRHMQGLEAGIDGLQVTASTSDAARHATLIAAAPPAESVPTTSSSAASASNGTPQDSGSESYMVDHTMPSLAGSTPPSSLGPGGAAPSPSAAFVGLQVPMHRVGIEERDLSTMMVYLDYTFPFLHPFYRPPFLDGGRGWLLVSLMRNKALFHIALSLSAFLASEVLSGGEAHSSCQEHSWDSLQAQQQLAVRELQADMQELNHRGVQGYLSASAHVMSSVLQLLSFEVALANTGNWQLHLDAASELFEQIMAHHGTAENGSLCWYRVLHQLGHGFVPDTAPAPAGSGANRRPWNADQAALRFFTATLLFSDTVAATALGRAPRLLRYHDHFLAPHGRCGCGDGHPSHPHVPHLRLDDFFGVPNAAVRAIAATAALDGWKREQKAANALSVPQLVARAAAIEQPLKAHMAELDRALAAVSSSPSPPPTTSASPPTDPLLLLDQAAAFATPPIPHPTAAEALLTARIWAQAAATYLLVAISGWQPGCGEIRASVSATAALLRRADHPCRLRAVVWPFCVTGCLAGPGEEEQGLFRDLVAALGPLAAFGSVREALAVMECVWAHRDCIGAVPQAWDLGVGLNCLGHAALLI